MGNSPAQVALEILGDARGAEAALTKLEQRGLQASRQLSQGFVQTTRASQQLGGLAEKAGLQSARGFQQANDAALLLGRTTGIVLPQQLSKVLARSSLIGPALSAAFNVAVIGGFGVALASLIPKIFELSQEFGGFTRRMREDFARAIEENNRKLVEFTTIGFGRAFLGETNLRIATLESEKAILERNAALAQLQRNLIAFAQIQLRLRNISNEELVLNARRIAQLEQLTALTQQQREESERLAKGAATDAARRLAESEVAAARAFQQRFEGIALQQGLIVRATREVQAALSPLPPELDRFIARQMVINQLAAGTTREFLTQQNVLALSVERAAAFGQEMERVNAAIAGQAGGFPFEFEETSIRIAEALDAPIQKSILTRQELVALGQQASLSFAQISGSVEGAGGVVLRVLSQMADQFLNQIAVQQAVAASTVATETTKKISTLSALKEIAAVKAVTEFAEGLAALGRYDFWGAAQHFGSSAVFAGVTALQIASAAGAFGGGGRVAGPGAGVAGPQGAAPGVLSGQGQQGQGTVTRTVFIEGLDPSKLFTGQQVMDLIDALNDATQNGGAVLRATTANFVEARS